MDDLTKNTFLEVGTGRISRRRPSRARWVVLGIVLLGMLVAAIEWWVGSDTVSTDDAFVDGRAITLTPQVAGSVVALQVRDNQRVRAGDSLVQIDPRAYAAARDQAAADLCVAQAQLAAARATLARADADWRRQNQLPLGAITQEALDATNATRLTARAGQTSAEAELRRTDTVGAQIAQAETNVRELEARVARAKAQLEQAELNLAWTRVTAPADGWITKRNVEAGNYVQPGQALLALVTPDIWVTANFKESDLAQLRPGQKVDISVDAYPALKLKGHVDSVQLGTGSRFAAFPPENATGNFVKIIQRVPVKIDIDSGLDPDIPLPLGISVVPRVHAQ
jgi:membrane fusion protein, multidrug efflux system